MVANWVVGDHRIPSFRFLWPAYSPYCWSTLIISISFELQSKLWKTLTKLRCYILSATAYFNPSRPYLKNFRIRYSNQSQRALRIEKRSGFLRCPTTSTGCTLPMPSSNTGLQHKSRSTLILRLSLSNIDRKSTSCKQQQKMRPEPQKLPPPMPMQPRHVVCDSNKT